MATLKAHRVRLATQYVMFILALMMAPVIAAAAPFAALVMDARTGEVLYAENADTRLHPASLTKMMTLYVTFQAIERGEISLDTMVTVSKHAAGQAPSRLGLRPGQRIALRYLIRAAAIKSANDAATAIGEAVGGSEQAFARRMTRTAKALGMTHSTFRNANGLTASGHLSTARDLTVLGRHLFYDFPQYYNIFSRRSADAGVAQVASTNRRFLDSYPGADGIKTGYTVPAGFNLTASAERGQKRIIATILGGKSTAWRNQKMAELLDLGFAKAPNRATVQKPVPPGGFPEVEPATAPDAMLMADAGKAADQAVAAAVAEDVAAAVADGGAPVAFDADMNDEANGPAAAKTLRVALAVSRSARPVARPGAPAPVPAPAPAPLSVAAADTGTDALAQTAARGGETVDGAALAAAEPGQTTVAKAPAGPVFAQTAPLQPETLAALAPAHGAAGPGDDPPAADPVKADGPAGASPADPTTGAVAVAALPEPSGANVADPAPADGTAAASPDGLGLDIDAAVMAAMGEDGMSGVPAAPRPLSRPARDGDGAGTVLLAQAPTAEGAAAATGTIATGTIATAATSAGDLGAPPVTSPVPSPVPSPVIPAPREAAAPAEQPPQIILAAATDAPEPATTPEVVTRMSTSGGRQWGINIGRYGSRYEAERMLIQTALVEMATLDEALRKVVGRGGGFDANFLGLTEESAQLACRRLAARAASCTVIPPTG